MISCVKIRTLLVLLSLSLPAALLAESISGSVTNSTNGKPAAGCTVTLVDPMGGMAEIGTATSDAQGKFRINAPEAKGPRLIRAERNGVNYFKMLTPGMNSVELSVYDSAATVEDIRGAADVVRFQTQSGQLQASELFAVSNNSKPPRTLAAEKTFEFVLPEGAQIDGAEAQAPNGQPISAPAKPTGEKNHYAFSFAIKPGETRFQVAYHVPYSGKAAIAPRLSRDFEHYVLVLPSTMKFKPRDERLFRPMNDQPGTNIEVVVQAKAGQAIEYEISGEGTIRDTTGGGNAAVAEEGGGAAMGGGAAESRPGGGLGKPIESPDPLDKARWPVLALLMLVLIGGGIWTRERTLREAPSGAPEAAVPVPSTAAAVTPAPPEKDPLLIVLRDELFALEMDHQGARITDEQYARARAALEETLHRALSRRHS